MQLLKYHIFWYQDLYVTCQDNCYCLTLADDAVREREIPELSTLHEKADAKVFSYIKYVNESGFDKAVVHVVDIDAIVLGLYYQAFINCENFIDLGCGSKRQLFGLKNDGIFKRDMRGIAYAPCINWIRLNKFHPRNRERKILQNL